MGGSWGFTALHLGLKYLAHNFKVTADVANLCRYLLLSENTNRAIVNPGVWVLHGLVARASTSWQSPNPLAWCEPSSGPAGVRTMLSDIIKVSQVNRRRLPHYSG